MRTRYFNLFYLQYAVKHPARVTVLGSPVAMVGGWVIAAKNQRPGDKK